MDSALRIAIPAKFREALDRISGDQPSQVYLLPAMGKVKVLPLPAFQSVKQQLEQLSPFDPNSEDLQTYIFGNMANCVLDAQNRIRLTPGLCEMAGLEKEVVVVGKQDQMEIWDAVKWKEFNAATSKNLREVMAQVFRSRQTGAGVQ
jgi:MraZ protein